MNHHLSTQEISAWLAGERTPEHERHAGECVECRAAIERIEGSLAQFRGVVKEYSGRELSQARPLVRPEARQRHGFGMMRLAAAAAMVVALAGVPLYLRDRARERAAEIARQDEALLEQVQTEISRSVPEPMEPLTKLVSWTSNANQ